MPIRQPLSLVQIKGLPGGLNTRDKETEIEDFEVTNCQNIELDEKEIRKRQGVSNLRTEAGTDIVRGLFEHYDDTNRQLLRTAGAAMHYDSGAAWTSITLPITLTTDLRMNFFTYNAKTYCCNRTDNVMMWDGATMVEKSAVPKFGFAVVWQNRAYLAGFTTAADTSTIKGSEIDDVETYPAANVLKLDPRNGQPITGVGLLPQYIVWFKERSIYLHTGGYDAQTSIIKVSDGIGCVAHRTIAYDGKGGLIFLAHDGVYHLQGTQLTRLSEKVQSIIEGMAWNQIAKACATFFDGKYRLSIPNAGSTENDIELVWDSRFGALTKNTGKMLASVYSFYKLSGLQELMLGSTTNSKVFKAFDTDADDGAAIDAFVETKVFTIDNPERRRKLKKIFGLTEKSGNWNLMIGYKLDDPISYNELPVNLAAETTLTYNSGLTYNASLEYGTGSGNKAFYLQISSPAWRTIQFRARNANASEPFVLKHLSAVFKQFSLYK